MVIAIALYTPLLLSCGYSMDAPGLPAKHRTLAVDTIQNKTFTAELDVRLQREVRRLLLRDAGIHVVPMSQTDLVLRVTLDELRISRARNITDTSVGTFAVSISGSVSLWEVSSRTYLINNRKVSARSRLSFSERTLETPAVRDEGINDALALFAERVVQTILVDF